jgi:hypothetical protein
MPKGVYNRTNIKPLADRLMAKVIPVTECGCWLFEGTLNEGGYGQINTGKMGKHSLAHRVSYSLFVGEIPKGKHVLHMCDVRCCVNPEHLWIGCHADNMADMSRKKRTAKPGAKLSQNSIREIKVSDEPVGVLADRHEISINTIYGIRANRIWRDV